MTAPTYYDVGTASVANGNTAVTGSGTLWLSNGVKAGDWFLDPAQAIPPARIASVESDTALTLAWDWLGTSLSGDAYEITLVPEEAENAARVRELLAELSVVAANGRGWLLTYSSDTGGSDPGAGTIAFDDTTLADATEAYVDDADGNAADVSAIMDAWGAFTGTVKGWLAVRGLEDPSIYHVWEVTAVADSTGFHTFTLNDHLGGSGALTDADSVMAAFTPSGPAGAAGSNGTDGVDGQMGQALGMVNGKLVASVAASALTIAIKTLAGSDPSGGDPVTVFFRNATAATGDATSITLTAATSLVIASGSTLGTSNGTPFRLRILGFDDGGTFRLGAVNPVDLSGPSLMALRNDLLLSSTAEGVEGWSDSAKVIYTNTAVTSKAQLCLGYMDWASGLTTAGTWDTGPSKIQLQGPGVPMPGDVVQRVSSVTSTTTTTTSSTYQNTNASVSIAPTAAPNLVHALSNGPALYNAAFQHALIRMHRGSTAIGSQGDMSNNGGPGVGTVATEALDAPGTTSSTTYMAKLKNGDNATTVSYPHGSEHAFTMAEEISA